MSSEQSNVTFNCRIKGEDLEWTINGKISSPAENTRLIQNGVEFNNGPRVNGEKNSTITFPNILHFNSTRVICVALNATGTLNSPEAVMVMAGL